MPDQPGQTTSRDFAFQSTDQAFAHHYEAGPTTNAPSASPTANQAVGPDALRFSEFGAQQTSLSSQASGGFGGYNFSTGGPLVWDWNNSIEFSDFANHYEPQGELVQELQSQSDAANDFSIPLPVTGNEAIFQASMATAQHPLSPPSKPPSRLNVQTGSKRRHESEPNSAVSQSGNFPTEQLQKPPKRVNLSRSSSSASVTSPTIAPLTDARRSSMTQIPITVAAPEPAAQPSSSTTTDAQKKKEPSKGTGPQGRVIDVSKPRRVAESSGGPEVLPLGKVFPIQIGSELFRLSGASLSSDAPSYFSHFFGQQLYNNAGRAGDLRTLYIDRDPETFRDIARHLQGYHVLPRDGEHFVKLFADAQFYSLPRLTKQLFSNDIFIRVGGTPFHFPRDLFSAPGDSPNYFSLGFAQFFSTPSEVFPGLDRNALLRPPSILPPAVPHKNGETFGELVKMLQGYNIEIRNDNHRSQLLRDARYFHLKGLEQKLIPCEISYNLKRNHSEILLRIDDIRQSGISFSPDSSSGSGSGLGVSPSVCGESASPAPSLGGNQNRAGTVSYARPYTDDHAKSNILILEISSGESTTLHLPTYAPKPSDTSRPFTLDLRATFHGSTLARITSLFGVIASRMGLPATQPLGLMLLASGGGVATQPVSPANSGVSERRVRVRISSDCYMEMDDKPVELGIDNESGRVGIKRTGLERRAKKARISEEHHNHDDDIEVARGEWLWGGVKADGVAMEDGEEQEEDWIVKRAHWRLRVEPIEGEGGKMQVVLCGVRIEGFNVEKSRNRSRGFLGSSG